MGNKQSKIKQKVDQALHARDQKIKKVLATLNTLLEQSRCDIQLIKQVSSSTATQLVKLLNEDKVSSVMLVYIFTYRAITVGKQLNVITDFDFTRAVQQAKQCDSQRKKTGMKNWTFEDGQFNKENFFPPLYGIPISIKDMFDMKGFPTTIGISHRILQIKDKDAAIITCFRNSGLIPFVRTNVPQLGMIFDCNNFLWGRSNNIWNLRRSVGGSSGGQAGLIAADCSPIGIGSDIAGSLRIPAAFCGIPSLKIGQTRISNCQTQFSQAILGKQTMVSVLGPMGKCVDDLALWMRVTTDEDYYAGQADPYNKMHIFDESKYLSAQKAAKLKIGFFKDLNLIESSPSYHRAIIDTKNLLQTLGHELVEVKIPSEDQLIKQFYTQVSAEGKSRSYMQLLGNEQPIPQYKQLLTIAFLPGVIRSLVKNLIKITQPRMGMIMDNFNQLNVYEYFRHVGSIKKLRKEFMKFWKENQLDFIICPGFGCPANRHGISSNITLAASYNYIWNILQVPVGNIPITVVKNDEQVYKSRYSDLITKALQTNSKGSAGLPISIQVVGLPFNEQRILGLMKIIEERIKFRQLCPAPKM